MNQRDHLVYMANQIARNFGTMADADAAAATADHIATFWDPRMKVAIIAHSDGLAPVAAAAIEILREQAHPPHRSRATEFNAVDETGHSDAG